MPGVKVRGLLRGLLFLGGAALVVVGPLDGCGGTLITDPGGAGTGGLPPAAGTTGSAGAAGTGGASGTGGTAFGEPVCASTVAKGAACGPADQQFCYKTCGPERTGVKAVTCTTTGTYAEMSGCAFDPNRDYSCYAIPSAANEACPVGLTFQASQPCDVPHCTLCNSLAGVVGGVYLDSTGAPKVGWCTCQLPNAAGVRTWTCASDTAWPCPVGAGCLPGSGPMD